MTPLSASVRVHRVEAARAKTGVVVLDRDPPVGRDEGVLLDAIAAELPGERDTLAGRAQTQR